MNLFIKIITTGVLLLTTSQVVGGWNKVDHPFDGMLMYTGDKQSHWIEVDTLSFWVMMRLYGDGERKQSKHHLMVDCKSLSYVEMYRESDFTDEVTSYEPIYPDGADLMYYPVTSKCDSYSEIAGGVCYPEEDLERTNKEELVDMLTEELEGKDGD